MQFNNLYKSRRLERRNGYTLVHLEVAGGTLAHHVLCDKWDVRGCHLFKLSS